ncbi:hypothetical protein Bbelb_093430 [Branchiostoma belcheri]|nr:hypothetical protein Bbelb_093430 [Branchiostoma belcheri]
MTPSVLVEESRLAYLCACVCVREAAAATTTRGPPDNNAAAASLHKPGPRYHLSREIIARFGAARDLAAGLRVDGRLLKQRVKNSSKRCIKIPLENAVSKFPPAPEPAQEANAGWRIRHSSGWSSRFKEQRFAPDMVLDTRGLSRTVPELSMVLDKTLDSNPSPRDPQTRLLATRPRHVPGNAIRHSPVIPQVGSASTVLPSRAHLRSSVFSPPVDTVGPVVRPGWEAAVRSDAVGLAALLDREQETLNMTRGSDSLRRTSLFVSARRRGEATGLGGTARSPRGPRQPAAVALSDPDWSQQSSGGAACHLSAAAASLPRPAHTARPDRSQKSPMRGSCSARRLPKPGRGYEWRTERQKHMEKPDARELQCSASFAPAPRAAPCTFPITGADPVAGRSWSGNPTPPCSGSIPGEGRRCAGVTPLARDRDSLFISISIAAAPEPWDREWMYRTSPDAWRASGVERELGGKVTRSQCGSAVLKNARSAAIGVTKAITRRADPSRPAEFPAALDTSLQVPSPLGGGVTGPGAGLHRAAAQVSLL